MGKGAFGNYPSIITIYLIYCFDYFLNLFYLYYLFARLEEYLFVIYLF